jgi:hypothetical protein
VEGPQRHGASQKMVTPVSDGRSADWPRADRFGGDARRFQDACAEAEPSRPARGNNDRHAHTAPPRLLSPMQTPAWAPRPGQQRSQSIRHHCKSPPQPIYCRFGDSGRPVLTAVVQLHAQYHERQRDYSVSNVPNWPTLAPMFGSSRGPNHGWLGRRPVHGLDGGRRRRPGNGGTDGRKIELGVGRSFADDC